jgi:hypothetical protein
MKPRNTHLGVHCMDSVREEMASYCHSQRSKRDPTPSPLDVSLGPEEALTALCSLIEAAELLNPCAFRGLRRANPRPELGRHTGNSDGQPHHPRGWKIEEHFEGRKRDLLHLPFHAPVFNPIEEDFSAITGMVREAEARIREG